MFDNQSYLNTFEYIVLSAIMLLREDAYGVPIREHTSNRMDKEVSIGQLYTTLERLEKKGFIESYMGESSGERGGRRKRYYKLCAEGISTLIMTEYLFNANGKDLALALKNTSPVAINFINNRFLYLTYRYLKGSHYYGLQQQETV
jgi:PadR family transcriptional regulator